ncbi:MAG: hypothetical protein J0I01_15215 [Stenotrophomonas nitritireducens]|uniref:hypothetical protein n=1 Tax=Stenotrophomonas nitritireducens TaxID=83617 RepID=UPI001ACEB031|nr:hypothetical protein [Stenotrophomonas nitritireducens]MBN8793573.1 hypothetical protein [Stenotrophomonas nitritireducens]MBN8797144.1 hypothetical protein [Stenotrophomonas nitritireducens]
MLNKKILVAAVIGGLFAGNAAAAVDLNATPSAPLKFASELKAPVSLTAAAAADDVTFKLGYNFSAGEVRNGRFECTNNIKMAGAAVASGTTGAAGVTVGSVNGINTNALFFSLTGGSAPAVTDAIVLTVSANNELTDYADVNCAFSIYDQPSQAQAGGETGRIYTTGFKPFITRPSGVVFKATAGKATANVSANPAYTQFTAGGLNGTFGSLAFTKATGVWKADGTQIALADIFADATTVTIDGNLASATKVTWNAKDSDSISAGKDKATFKFDTAAGINKDDINGNTIYVANGTGQILVEKNYVAKLNGVAKSANIVLGTYGDQVVGEIDRNGTELQAPLVQVPGGWLARIALTNTGASDRAYSIRTLDAANNDDGTAGQKLILNTVTGTLPKNGTKVIKLADADIDLATGGRRGTVIVTVDAPTTEIQGLYQVVNPNNGLVNNHIMTK